MKSVVVCYIQNTLYNTILYCFILTIYLFGFKRIFGYIYNSVLSTSKTSTNLCLNKIATIMFVFFFIFIVMLI